MPISNLYLFPALPEKRSGYEWAVKSDINQLDIGPEDFVIFYTASLPKNNTIELKSKNIYYIERKKSIYRTITCLIKGIHPSFFLSTDWNKLPSNVKSKEFNIVFFGDSIFYPIVNEINYRNATFRFHNLWLRILKSNKWRWEDVKNYINMLLISRVEKKILRLKDPRLLFITEKDKNFALSYNKKSDLLSIDIALFQNKATQILDINKKAIIWYGSVSTHKDDSIKQFTLIFNKLRILDPNIIFLLFGKGTEKFNDEKNGVLGMGFYSNNNTLPITNKCIYINPDTTGGGIKIKNFDIIKCTDIRYLSTPEGFEGCEQYIRDGIKILSLTKWLDYLTAYFRIDD